MVAEAENWLGEQQLAGFTNLRKEELACINAWTKIRNCIAHKSPSARKQMNEALKSASLSGRYKGGNSARRDIGYFLKSKPAEFAKKLLAFKRELLLA